MKTKRRDLISREGHVLHWTVDLFARAEGTKNVRSRDSGRYLILEGEFTEPLKGVTEFLLQVNPDVEPSLGARDMPCVGSVIQLKPNIQAAGTLTPQEFNDLLVLATSGKLRSFRMAFEEPRYGRALIASMSFSSRPPEVE